MENEKENEAQTCLDQEDLKKNKNKEGGFEYFLLLCLN